MAAAQHSSRAKQGKTIIGHRQQHKGQEGRDKYNTIVLVTYTWLANVNLV
jgi:hypothetical protein